MYFCSTNHQMAEEQPESTHLKTTSLPNLAHDQVAELVWENGQILTRGLSTNPSCISSSSPLAKTQIRNDKYMHISTTKRSLLETIDSIWHVPSLLCPSSHSEAPKLGKNNFHPELYEYQNDFDIFFENTRNNACDKHNTEAHVVPVYKEANPEPENAFNYRAMENPDQLNTGQVNQCSLQQIQASTPLNRTIANKSQCLVPTCRLPDAKIQQIDSGSEKHLGLQNFSPFLRPVTRLASGPSSPILGDSSKPYKVLKLKEQISDSESAKGFQNEAHIQSIRPIAKPAIKWLPDEQSEAVVPIANTVKEQLDREECTDDQVAPGNSISSQGASNEPTYSPKRRCEDTELMACPSDHKDEEEHVVATGGAGRGSAGGKRKRNTKVRSMSERKRRNTINKKIRALRDLIPNSNKVDKASMLDQAIEYMKNLQLQLQIMSMGGAGLCMPPMMLPTGLQQQYLQAQHWPQYFPSASLANMGMTMMPMGVGCTPACPFSASVSTFGLQGQILPALPMPSPTPFLPSLGGPNNRYAFPLPTIGGMANSEAAFLGSLSMFS